jgi:hypothetical protein
MSRIVFPGPQPPSGGLTIHVPRGYEARKIGDCYLCGAEFAEGDNVVAHMKACVSAAGHDVRQEREDKKERMAPFMDPNYWDPELESHMKKVGERMKREGRWTVNPNERAGFS